MEEGGAGDQDHRRLTVQEACPTGPQGRKPPRLARQRSRPDWPAIESDWREGRLSLREMAARHGCAHSTIANKATREGWSRCLRQPCAATAAPAVCAIDAPTDLFTDRPASSLG